MDAIDDLKKKKPTELELCVLMAGTLCDPKKAAEELRLLYLELVDARKVIENYSDRTDLDDCFSADTFLKKYPKETK